MDSIPSPHDTFFRESFTRREVACDFLRCRLPPELLAELDLTTLEISKDSYVSSDLRTAYSDLVKPLPEPIKPFVPSFGCQLVDVWRLHQRIAVAPQRGAQIVDGNE